MNNERLILKARLVEYKADLRRMSIRADSFFRTIRDILDPFTGKEYTELDLDAAKIAMDDFHDLWIKGRELKERIAKLEHELE